MEQEIPAPGGQKKWYSCTIESILTNEKYKGSALLQKKFTVDFLTKKTKVNKGEVRSISWNTAIRPSLTQRNLRWCRRKWYGERRSAESTAAVIYFRQESSAPAVEAKIARRLSRKELLEGMARELENADLLLTQFDEKLWRIMVENVTVGLDGEMVFRFRNGMEVTIE